MATRRACCDIFLSLTGFRLCVRDLDALERKPMETEEIAFAWDRDPDPVSRFLSTIHGEFDEIATRAFLPESVLIRGKISDYVPEQSRGVTVLKEASMRLAVPKAELHVTFFPGRLARNYILLEQSSIRDIESYPLFRFLGVSILCASNYFPNQPPVILHVFAPIPFASISLSRLLSVPTA